MFLLRILSTFLIIFLLPLFVYGGTISNEVLELINQPGSNKIPVIIKFKKEKIKTSLTDRTALRRELIRLLRGEFEKTKLRISNFFKNKEVNNLKELWHINGFALEAPPQMINQLASLFDDIEIKLDSTFTIPVEQVSSDGLPLEWNIDMIRASEMWALNFKGQNVVVANLDTGVDYTHPDLYDKWRGGNNSWYDTYNVHQQPYDASGHGTQTMGIIVGGNYGGTNIGVAPEAKWIGVKIFDDNGVAKLSNIHQAFAWLLDPDGNPDTDDIPDIVNNSWGFNDINQCNIEFQDDIELLKNADVAVVFSAGNSGPSLFSSVSPSNNLGSLSVGAIDNDSNIAYFSSRGPSTCTGDIYPLLVAPGVNVKTTDLFFNGRLTNPYVFVSGTSFSAPHVAGALALLKSAFPNKPMAELEYALKRTAKDLGDIGPDNNYGFGLIDVKSAYNYLANIAEIYVTPKNYVFKKVIVGNSSIITSFLVTNKGFVGLTVNSVMLTGNDYDNFFIVADNCSGVILNNNEVCSIDVVFYPQKPGTLNAKIIIFSDDPFNPQEKISLTGIAIFQRLTLLSPNGGEVLHAGDYYEIKWGGSEKTIYYTIQFSKNGGYTWHNIAQYITSNSFLWKVPTDKYNRSKCLIKVLGFDFRKILIESDESNGYFTIIIAKIITPLDFDTVLNNNNYLITWQTYETIDVPNKTLIYFTRDSGLTWRLITVLDGNPGSYLWFTFAKPSRKCYIKIVFKGSKNNTIAVVKNKYPFSIK
jgi:serine protease AprX